jgi:signal peptidase I
MKPTFMEEDKIFVDKLSYRFHPPERGDIIVFKYPLDPKKDFVKRLAGLPGDSLEIRKGVLFVNGKPMTDPPFGQHTYYNVENWKYGKAGQVIPVPQGYYFALGDNSAHSDDSRDWGFIPKKNMVGKAFMIWWPPPRIKITK